MNTSLPHHGFLLINKPAGITSYACVSHIKKIIRKAGYKEKIGHAGTLDDFATGLLIIAIGRESTKKLGTFLTFSKRYIVKAKLGELTDSLDLTGKLIETKDASQVTPSMIEYAMKKLQPSYKQIPPIYSALKYQGKPLYQLARNNLKDMPALEFIVQEKARTVELYELHLLEFEFPFFTFEAHVSKGTYIRSLANDIAEQCNTFATTIALERTQVQNFLLANANHLEKIQTFEDICKNIQI